MRIPDLNVLLYAVNRGTPNHDGARRWLERCLSSPERTGFTSPTLTGFVRIATHPAIFERPLSITVAMDYVDSWSGHPSSVLVGPGRDHWALLRRLLEKVGTAGNLTTDAHLAALAIEHGASLASHDADFHRFEGLSFEYLG